MAWQAYNLDQKAQELVLQYRHFDVLNESHKMRTTLAYGLERFWGEHLRLGTDTHEGQYWRDVWEALAREILHPAKIELPGDRVELTPVPRDASQERKQEIAEENTGKIKAMASKLWSFSKENPDDCRIALAVLTQFCDCIVWWTQRYKD
jgi:hypothetical protein